MINLKNNKVLALAFALVTAVAFTFTACDTDECKDVDCGLNGTCLEGICQCDAGYSGLLCDVSDREGFLNDNGGDSIWDCDDLCGTSGTWEYDATIKPSSNATQIIIENFGAFGTNLTAAVTGNTFSEDGPIILTTPTGDFTIRNISGTLQNDGNTVDVSYETQTTVTPAAWEICNGTWTKQ